MSQVIMQMLEKNPNDRPDSWDDVLRRLEVGAPRPGALDVSSLIRKSTESQLRRTQEQTVARESAERETDRQEMQDAALEKPVQLLREVVEEYNATAGPVKLVLDASVPSLVVLTAVGGLTSLEMRVVLRDDIDLAPQGLARMVLIVSVKPTPTATTIEERLSRASFGSFNLIYWVRDAQDLYGEWQQLRFEDHPIAGSSNYPHWFGLAGIELPRELKLLNTAGMYQHQLRPMGVDWFLELIGHLL